MEEEETICVKGWGGVCVCVCCFGAGGAGRGLGSELCESTRKSVLFHPGWFGSRLKETVYCPLPVVNVCVSIVYV